MNRLPGRLGLLLAWALAAVVACADESPPAAEAAPADSDWLVRAAALPDGTVRERFLAATLLLLGTPYENGPLGEGDAGGPDPDPRVDFARADCVTWLEQALALALMPPASEGPADDAAFLARLDAIRYRDGEVDFASRNHYMVADWIPANDWLVEDVTPSFEDGFTVEVTRTIDRAEFLRGQGAEPRPGVDEAREYTVRIIPVESLPDVESRIEAGDLVFWVGGVDGIFVLHTGLAVRGPEGELLFRHASSREGRALEEPFADYAAARSFRGFLVLRLREDPWPAG